MDTEKIDELVKNISVDEILDKTMSKDKDEQKFYGLLFNMKAELEWADMIND